MIAIDGRLPLPIGPSEYRHCPGHVGYAVGGDGSVWSCRHKRGPIVVLDPSRWRELKAGMRKGYWSVMLRGRTPPRVVHVHRLVLEAFVGKKPDGQLCRHLDGNPLNNSHLNLAWGTPQQNQDDRIVHGTTYGGERHHSAKLTEGDVRRIRAMAKDASRREIADMFGVKANTVSSIILGQTWRSCR